MVPVVPGYPWYPDTTRIQQKGFIVRLLVGTLVPGYPGYLVSRVPAQGTLVTGTRVPMYPVFFRLEKSILIWYLHLGTYNLAD